MTDASGENEHMPDGMIIWNPFPREEHNSDGVKQSAREQPEYARLWNSREQRFDGDHGEPAHQHVAQSRDYLETINVKKFEEYPDGRKRPDQRKKRPAPEAS